MRRDPSSILQRLALADVGMDVIAAMLRHRGLRINGCLVLFRWFIRLKSFGVDGQGILLTIGQEDPNRRVPDEYLLLNQANLYGPNTTEGSSKIQ